uniref:YjbQ family protein n=1 Tax=Thermofilum pendens TaxID=2269 RepID=A0A7C3SMB5_THEPE
MRVVKVERIRFTTYGPNKLFDLTDRVLSLTHSVEEGAVFLQAVGSTGALLVLPRSEEVLRAFEQDLWDLVPTLGWRHPGNAYAHLRSTLMGTTLALPVLRGQVPLSGSGIFFLENQPAMNRPRVMVAALLENRAR